jgi:putative glutamine amidotransferase
MNDNTPKPLIGITAINDEYAEPYVNAVARSDGQPRVVLPSRQDSSASLLCRISGLVVCGATAGDCDGPELELLVTALNANLPVLCLSRGLWVLNAALGGKQPQDTPAHSTQSQDGEDVSSYHHIFITPGSKLAAVVGSGGFVRVNSRHSKGLREAQKSPELLASAYCLDDGVIEALESPNHRWVIGVQFNPERFNEIPPHFMRLFQSMVDRAKEYQNGGENG